VVSVTRTKSRWSGQRSQSNDAPWRRMSAASTPTSVRDTSWRTGGVWRPIRHREPGLSHFTKTSMKPQVTDNVSGPDGRRYLVSTIRYEQKGSGELWETAVFEGVGFTTSEENQRCLLVRGDRAQADRRDECGSHGTPGTLLWEFGRLVARAFDRPDDESAIRCVVSAMDGTMAELGIAQLIPRG
jgi:hypothetical protein